MKRHIIMLCMLPIAGTLTGCGTTGESGGPTVSVSFGYGGINASASWTPKPKPAPAPEAAGKSPVSAAP